MSNWSFERRQRLLPFFIVGLVFVSYANSVNNTFHYDDLHVLVENPHIEDLALVPEFFSNPAFFSRDADKGMYRPLLLTSFVLNYAWSQREVYSYHLVNISMHAGTSVVVWLLLGTLGSHRTYRLWGTLIFALHPICTEPVNYISSRSELMVGFFVVVSFWLYEKSRVSGLPTYIQSVVCFAAGLLTKSVAIGLPVLLLARDWSEKKPFTHMWFRYVPYLVCSIIYLVLVSSFVNKAVVDAPVRTWDLQIATQIKAWVYYTKLLFFPVGLNVHHQFFESAVTPVVLLYLAFLLSVFVFLVAGGKMKRKRLFGAIWFAISLAPASVVPLYVLVNDHRLYLPLIGLVIIGGTISDIQMRRLRYFIPLVVVLFGLLVAKRNTVWANDHTLWSDAARKSPQSLVPVAYVHLGNYAKDAGHYEEAVKYFEQALSVDRDHPAALNNLGTVFDAMGATDKAISVYERLLDKQKNAMEVRYNLARVLQQSGRHQRARVLYKSIADTSIHFALVANNLGTLFEAEGRLDSALHYYGHGLAHPKQAADAKTNFDRLAQALFRVGDHLLVESVCAALLAQNPKVRDLLFYRSVALFQQQRYSESIDVNRTLVSAFPEFDLGYLQLANALESSGRGVEAIGVYRQLLEIASDPEMDRRARERLVRLQGEVR